MNLPALRYKGRLAWTCLLGQLTLLAGLLPGTAATTVCGAVEADLSRPDYAGTPTDNTNRDDTRAKGM